MTAVADPEGGARGGAALRLTLVGPVATARRGDAAKGMPLARLDAALLAVLAVEGAVSRQRLMQLLAPDDDQAEDPRNVLRQRLFRLRRAVGEAVIARGDLLSLAEGAVHDVGSDGDGVLLAAHDYAGFPAFESWLDAQRRALASQRRGSALARIDECEKEGRLAEAGALAERMADADPRDEASAQRLMKLLYIDGRRAAAIAAFERFAAALRNDAGDAPSAATVELLATIRAARDPLPLARRVMPASVLRPPRLVGREVERLRLQAAWATERVFWLLGEAGLGKTRLIGEFVAQACAAVPEPTEALVVAARPGDAGVPYASLGRGLRALVERRPQLLEDGERDGLARVMPQIDRTASVSAAHGLRLVHTAIESLLAEAHRAGLAAIVIDDLHFADGASVEALQGLVLGDRLSGLRWGFAQRAGEGSPEVEALRTALEESQRVDVLPLAPLDEAGLRELVASLGLPGLDATRLAPMLAQHTGGNPMYALETIKQLVLDPGALGDASLPRPASVGQLIERRLRQLSSSALGLARIAAVAGVDFSIELAEAALGTRALALADAWRELEAAQVLRGDAFAHDLVHEAVLAGLPAPIAAHTHGAVAAFLESHDGEPARVAAHWLDAGKPQRALAALHAAARAANRAMRRKEEAQFLERAARIETEAGDPAAFDTWHQRVEALWAADFHAFDTDLFDRFEQAAATPRQQAIARSLRANWVQQCGNHEEAKRLARSAVALADLSGDEATVAYARIRLAEALDFDGDAAAALTLLEPLQGWAAERASKQEQAEFCCRLALALDNAGRGGDARIHHRRAIELSRGLHQWSDLVTLLGNLSISWDKSGYLERSIEAAREALELVAAHDEARGCGVTLARDMFQLLRDCGRYEEAFRWAEPALAAEQGARAALTRCNIGLGWIHLGQHARAQREIDAALATETPAWMRARMLQVKARLLLALDQRGARRLLDESMQIVQAQSGRQSTRASIALDHALTLEPPAALAATRSLIAEAERLGLAGMVLAGHVRAMRFAADAGADAAVHANAALATDFGGAAGVYPSGLYPAELWLNAWRALRLAGRDADARAALSAGVAWIERTRTSHVPEPFRDSFVRANPVNLQLLRAAAQAS